MRPEDWCEACDNESADVCLQAIVDKESSSKQALQSSSAENDNQNKGLLIAGTFLGGFFVGLILMAVTFRFTRPAAPAKVEFPLPPETEEVQEAAIMIDLEAKGMNSEIN